MVRSRPVPQLVEKSEGPKGFDEPRKFDFCGIDPARRRESKAELAAVADGLFPESMAEIGEGRKGLVDGVGLDVFAANDGCILTPLMFPTGENRDGTVPARARRAGLFIPLSDGGTRSGKPSCDGDSGIFSRRGVEFPLVGGPHILGDNPSCA